MRSNPTSWRAIDSSRNWHEHAFFGLHYDLHAGVKDTELGAALTHEHLRTELEKVRPDWIQCDCKGHPGYTSWPTTVGSASPGIVNDALRIHRDVSRELGIPLIMHYSGVWDDRALELHPDWACLGPTGGPSGKEGFVTGGTCNLSPYTAELMIPQMLELIDTYDVDGFWVDGENWATKPCYCDRCTKSFTQETGIAEIPKAPHEPNWQAWADFHRQLFVSHVQQYAAAVHARKPTCTICSNWMYTVGHPGAIQVDIDYQSGDFSWVWSLNDAILEARYMDGRRQLSWDLMCWGFTTAEGGMGGWTFKTVAQLCQEAASVISLGGAFQIYNQPQRNGHLTGWHQDVMAGVARFVRARQPWCQGTESVPQVALLHSTAHFYSANGDLLMAKWGGGHTPLVGALHALLENGCTVDVLGEEDLNVCLADYPLVVVAEQTHPSPELIAALTTYVKHGGKLLLSGTHVAKEFGELAGIEPVGELQEGHFYLQIGREATTCKGPRQPVITTTARPLWMVMKGQEPGFNATDGVAVTLNTVGAGQVLAVHSQFFTHFAGTHYPRSRQLVGEWLMALAPEFIVTLEAPPRVQLILRRQSGRLIAHLFNTGTSHPTAPGQVMIEEVPPVGPVTLRIRQAVCPRAVYLAPTMEGLTWTWRDGLLTVKVVQVGILDSVIVETAL